MQRPALIGGEPDGDHAGVGDLADAARDGRHARRSGDAAQEPRRREPHRGSIGTHMADPDFQGLEVGVGLTSNDGAQCEAPIGDGWWSVEPDVGRVAHGVPARVDRLRGLGNAVVPQIPEMIGRAILQAA
jgi:DNA (cytosine-5)-methyltransferase 1